MKNGLNPIRTFPLLFLVLLLSAPPGCKTNDGSPPPNAEAVVLQALRGIEDTVDIATRAWADYAVRMNVPADKRKPVDELHDSYRNAMLSADRIIDSYRAAKQAGTADTTTLETALKLVQAASNEFLFRIAKEIK